MPNLKCNVQERRSDDVFNFYYQLFRLCNVNTTFPLWSVQRIHQVSPSPTRQNIQSINNETQSNLSWIILRAFQDMSKHFPSGECITLWQRIVIKTLMSQLVFSYGGWSLSICILCWFHLFWFVISICDCAYIHIHGPGAVMDSLGLHVQKNISILKIWRPLSLSPPSPM